MFILNIVPFRSYSDGADARHKVFNTQIQKVNKISLKIMNENYPAKLFW